MIHNISTSNSIFNTFLAEMRDITVQNDPMRFRRNLERVAEILAYEVSKKLNFQEQIVTTPLGEASVNLLKEQPILATILRAGLGMHNGLLNYFDKAESAFVSAYRKHLVQKNLKFMLNILHLPASMVKH